MKTSRNRQRGSGFFKNLFGKNPAKTTKNLSQQPSVNNIKKTHAIMVNPVSGHAQKATEARSALNAAQTVGQTLGLGTSAFAGIAAGMALAGKGALLGAAASFPPLLAALMGTYLACLFIARQRNINRELMANLYIIKMEIERMQRVYAVIEVIAKERGIDLNTVALRGIVTGLGKKIMIFAGKDTKIAIENVEKFLRAGDINAAAKLVSEAELNVNNLVSKPEPPMKGGFMSYIQDGTFASWKARWLSPGETLRIIIRDVTIANIWFSIMIAEYTVFKEYMELISPPKTYDWVKSDKMKELMIANRQLQAMTTDKNSEQNNTFYLLLTADPEKFKSALELTISAFNQRTGTADILKEAERGRSISEGSDPTGAPPGAPGNN